MLSLTGGLRVINHHEGKFIDHVHTYKGVPVRVSDTLKQEILTNFKSLLRMKEQMMEELSVAV